MRMTSSNTHKVVCWACAALLDMVVGVFGSSPIGRSNVSSVDSYRPPRKAVLRERAAAILDRTGREIMVMEELIQAQIASRSSELRGYNDAEEASRGERPQG
jgi:hypothetical protein